jgi:acyl-CoA synthetase (NDP forming)
VSFGNAVVCEVSDFLEYFRDDPATAVIAMYVEGVRNGRRFFDVLRATTPQKPVVVWKGGLTEAGERAILSHTAALATPAAVWNGMVRQAGAVSAGGLEELIDIVATLQAGKTATGFRAGLIAMTGGLSVAITDAFTRAGLEVPLLSESSYRRLYEFFDIVGGSFRNPLDAGNTIGMGFRTDNLERLLDVLDADNGIDVIGFDLGSGLAFDLWREQPASFAAMLDVLTAFSRRSAKPLAIILEPAHQDAEAAQMRSQFTQRGLLTLASAERAAVALRKVTEYQRFRDGLG